MKRRWVIAGLVIGALLFACFVWPTPWAYGVEYWDPMDRPLDSGEPVERVPVPVRTNRFTGEKQNQGGTEGEWGHYVW